MGRDIPSTSWVNGLRLLLHCADTCDNGTGERENVTLSENSWHARLHDLATGGSVEVKAASRSSSTSPGEPAG